MNKTKSKSNTKSVCANCIEERRKGDTTRKYAHELKNIFITISTVVNSEVEVPIPSRFSMISNSQPSQSILSKSEVTLSVISPS